MISSASATVMEPMAWRASTVPPVRWAESSRLGMDRTASPAGIGSIGKTSVATLMCAASRGVEHGREFDHGRATHQQEA